MAVALRVLLGVVLVIAGVTKLSLRNWGRDTAYALGLPVVLTAPTPVLELLIGAGLITGVRLMPEAALGLLLVYTGVLLVQISKPDAPPCACFGRATTPITWRTIARNVVLLVLALVSVAA